MGYELVDAIGITSIAAIIRQSGLQKISITKYGAGKGTLPVFEDNDSKTNDRIVKGFTDWATNILHGNQFNDMVYDLLLYNEPPELDDPDEENEKEKPKQKRGYSRANKMRFCIQLYRPGTAPGTESEKGVTKENISACNVEGMTPEKVAEMVKTMLVENEVLRRVTVVEAELRVVNERIDEIIDEIEELSEDIEGIDGNNVSGTQEENQKYYFDKLIDLMNVKASNGVKLSGTENEPSVVKANINKAISILYKHDKKIDQHLLKLANLAETNKGLFEQIVAQLEKM